MKQQQLCDYIIQGTWGDEAVLSTLSGLSGQDKKRALIYRQNFILSLEQSLQQTYKRIHTLVGDDNMRYLCHHYRLQHPPKTPILDEYGKHFAHFLAAQQKVMRDYPFLPHMAEIEYTMERCIKSPAPTGFTIDTIQQYDIEEYSKWQVDIDKNYYIIEQIPQGLYAYMLEGAPSDAISLTQRSSILLVRVKNEVVLTPIPPWYKQALSHLPCTLEEWSSRIIEEQSIEAFQTLFILLVKQEIIGKI